MPALFKCSQTSTSIEQRKKSESVRSHALLSHFSEKLNGLFRLPSLNISCKPSIPSKTVQLDGPWCHGRQGRQFCSHLWGFSTVVKPECVLRPFMLEIRKSFIHLLLPAIAPLRRNWKELPPKFLYLVWYRWCNICILSRCQRSVTTSHQYMSYLSRLKDVSMAHCHHH
jgi:hypothetical protein